MHPNPIFRQKSRDDNIAFAQERGFGALAVTIGGAPVLSHIPFILDEGGTRLAAHLVRSNPIARALAQPRPAVIAVTGADGYISPDWYDMPDQVPTWNYVAVHLRGTLRALPDAALRPHLDRLADAFETRLAPKPAWRIDKMSGAVLERMMRMIVAVEMTVDDVQGTWKFSQNKPASARLSAADAVTGGTGQELAALAALMREAEPE